MSEDSYVDVNIQVLEGLEAVRMRPGMYVGSQGPAGVRAVVWEVVSNVVDEHLAGHATTLQVQQGSDGWWMVADDGRGLPADVDPGVLERVFCTLHAGSTADGHSPHVHVGLHGAGLPVVCALSAHLVVVVDRPAGRYSQAFARGRAVGPATRLGDAQGRGTSVRFLPDPDVFGQARLVPGVRDRLRELAFLNPGLRVQLGSELFHEPDGPLALARCLVAGPVRSTLYESAQQGDLQVRVAVAWGSSHGEHQRAFTNQLPMSEGGTHLDEALAALTPTTARGRVVVVDALLHAPTYAGRVRSRLVDEAAGRLAHRLVTAALPDLLAAQPDLVA